MLLLLVGHAIILNWEMPSKNISCLFYFDNEYFKRFHRPIF